MTTFVKGYFRGKREPSPAYVKKTEEFYPDLGDMLVGALMAANLAEPLDELDMAAAQRERIRETW